MDFETTAQIIMAVVAFGILYIALVKNTL